MRSIALSILVSVLCVSQAAAQSQVRYSISFANRAHHEAEITVSFTNLDDRPLQLRMSRSSPGRYALHEFAKNVYNFRASGLDGRAVTVSRPNNHQWDVAGHGGAVSITYTLYGDHADGTYTGIDRTHGHLNMPATFMWARGTEARPIELFVQVPQGSGWRVATQLAATDDPFRFEAPDLEYFLDSPTEVSDFWGRSWQLDGRTRGGVRASCCSHRRGVAERVR
jgi:predicted metalloprotease with PDZ domain